ncbi:diguanylate cyclase (GGDEF)-like protein [Catenuloplanes nepalensis]|uniref:Diguanylate cyclase (GGDEF)-like protein n=1 Tax=Catenuloplanes nepalensis TaxID=587533 RepID=A0ABT9MX61_9ACTN|nr:response regulator [Catenuloplanes nepalensis]MDP9796018.1 diguanylate cyclase (GGDEF)-like protein [Catenuloplanes nepalensis]
MSGNERDEFGPEPGRDLILVVDDDRDIAHFVALNLKLDGFDVVVANDGKQALEEIDKQRPSLAVLDLMMPEIDGLELTRRLRANPITSTLPIIMLTAKSMTIDKVNGLKAGADDYMVKPFDTSELVARVRNTLNRNQESREVSPLTGLPGNSRVKREISDRMRSGADYAVGYIDIDRFKAVNDVYGFDRGDAFIQALARSLHRAVVQVGLPPVFLGHIGGDDFIFICHPEQIRPLTQAMVVDFERAADELYDPEHARRGYIEVPDRRGGKQRAALVTLSIGVATTGEGRRFDDARIVMAIASDMKKTAKNQPGSYVAIDKRGNVQT